MSNGSDTFNDDDDYKKYSHKFTVKLTTNL